MFKHVLTRQTLDDDDDDDDDNDDIKLPELLCYWLWFGDVSHWVLF